MSSNIKIGTQFERELASILSVRGFWVHRMAQNAAGQQPADLIVCKGKYHGLIDCKVISTEKGFPFSRIEDNQRTAMSVFHQKAHEYGWFALLPPDGDVRMISYSQILGLESLGKASLSFRDRYLMNYTMSLDEWIRRAEAWK